MTAIVAAIGVVFFRVIWPFVPPLFFAGMLAMLFWPVFEWLAARFRGRRRLAALATTLAVVVIVLIPLGGLLVVAGYQLFDAGRDVAETLQEQTGGDPSSISNYPAVSKANEFLREHLSDENYAKLRDAVESALTDFTKTIYDKTLDLAGGVFSFGVALAVTLLALYYAFADGPELVGLVRKLSPLEEHEEQELSQRFQQVCRGVVLGTIVSGLVQGLLAGLGFWVIGLKWVWLLTVLTMFCSLIPFLGAAGVWVVVAVGLAIEGRWGSAVGLALYGTFIVSASDNVVRALVLKNRANMHPLVAFITVLGALQVIGLWGIFVGPLTAAFFLALLRTLHQRLTEQEVAGT